MFKKIAFAASLLCFSFAVSGQNAAKYVGVKCPTCPCDLPPLAGKLLYKKEGWNEIFSGDFRGSTWSLNWETMTVTLGGRTYQFTHYTNDQKQVITVEWTDANGDLVVRQNFYNSDASYRATYFVK